MFAYKFGWVGLVSTRALFDLTPIVSGRVACAPICVCHLDVLCIITDPALTLHRVMSHVTASLIGFSSNIVVDSRLSFLFELLLLPLKLHLESIADGKATVQRLYHNCRSYFYPSSLSLFLA